MVENRKLFFQNEKGLRVRTMGVLPRGAPVTIGNMIGFLVLAAMLISTAHAYPTLLACSRSASPGATIMGVTVTAGTVSLKNQEFTSLFCPIVHHAPLSLPTSSLIPL